MKNIFTIIIAVLVTASMYLPQFANAQVPQKMSYQAVIRDGADALISNQTVGMQISILQGSINGTMVYSETQTPTTNINGLVSLEFGGGVGFDTIDWANGPYFIKTETDPTGGTAYTISGTSELMSVPFALFSANGTPGPPGPEGPQGPQGIQGPAGPLVAGTASQTLRHDGTNWVGDSFLKNSGEAVGINSYAWTKNKLTVLRPEGETGADSTCIFAERVGMLGAENGGSSWAKDGVDAAIKGYTYWGNNYTAGLAGYSYNTYKHSSAIIGSHYTANYFGALAYRDNDSTTWAGYFNGNVNITDNIRIQGSAPGTGKVLTSDSLGNATWENANPATPWQSNSGNIFYNSGNVGIGANLSSPQYPLHVVGIQNSNYIGVGHFENKSTSYLAAGVSGVCDSTDNDGFGVYGRGGYNGVRGEVWAPDSSNYTHYGVRGYISAPYGGGSNYGLSGNVGNINSLGGSSYGVSGSSSVTGSGNNYGVYGQTFGTTTGSNYAVYANGDMGASGTKSFVIDHPLDPENKYLKHYCVESPEVLNMYRGTVQLDSKGEAIVELPDYFDAININFSYHLTPIGSPAQLYVKEKIREKQFTIAGGEPGTEASWIVYAERNDLYLQQNPKSKKVEIEKTWEKGKYTMPELYSQPEEMGIHYNKDDKDKSEKR